jgi:hypothetical protein
MATNVKIMDWLPQNDLLGKSCLWLLLCFHWLLFGTHPVLKSRWALKRNCW